MLEADAGRSCGTGRPAGTESRAEGHGPAGSPQGQPPAHVPSPPSTLSPISCQRLPWLSASGKRGQEGRCKAIRAPGGTKHGGECGEGSGQTRGDSTTEMVAIVNLISVLFESMSTALSLWKKNFGIFFIFPFMYRDFEIVNPFYSLNNVRGRCITLTF